MNDTILWLHDEMLGPHCLVEGVPAVFVFDEQWIAEQRLSLKQIVFMYECLRDLSGVEVRKGSVVEQVSAFAAERGATRILTRRSPLPRLKRQGAELGVEWIEPEPIATLPEGADLKRFSRYWRKVEKQILRHEG